MSTTRNARRASRCATGCGSFTVWYAPKDTSRPWPFLLHRTPYGVGPYGVDNWPTAQNARLLHKVAPSPELLRDGYVFVHQDVRGRMMSEGTFVDVRPVLAKHDGPSAVDETTDAYDTLAWLVKNVPNTTPKVGTWGISYPGFYAAQTAISGHPALVAASPQAPVTDWFVGDDFHHNGAFFLADAFDFYSSFGRPRPRPRRRASGRSPTRARTPTTTSSRSAPSPRRRPASRRPCPSGTSSPSTRRATPSGRRATRAPTTARPRARWPC